MWWNQNLLAYETIKQVLQFGSIMGTINDVAFIFVIKLSLRAQFTPKIFGRIGWWSAECFSHFRHIDDDGFDTIAFTLNFGHEPRHFVAIEGIAHASVDVHTHPGWCETLF